MIFRTVEESPGSGRTPSTPPWTPTPPPDPSGEGRSDRSGAETPTSVTAPSDPARSQARPTPPQSRGTPRPSPPSPSSPRSPPAMSLSSESRSPDEAPSPSDVLEDRVECLEVDVCLEPPFLQTYRPDLPPTPDPTSIFLPPLVSYSTCLFRVGSLGF